jgi:hypothetical protein
MTTTIKKYTTKQDGRWLVTTLYPTLEELQNDFDAINPKDNLYSCTLVEYPQQINELRNKLRQLDLKTLPNPLDCIVETYSIYTGQKQIKILVQNFEILSKYLNN